MKMIIDSGFKEFDRQTNCISRGNAICNTQYSNCIRPYTEIECNGHTFPEGHLFNYDLQYFNISSAIRDMIKKMGKMVCLYEFFIYKHFCERRCYECKNKPKQNPKAKEVIKEYSLTRGYQIV